MHKMAKKIGTAKDTPEFKIQLYDMEANTQQLVRDTYGYLQEIHALSAVSMYEKERNLYRERLQDEFLFALNNFYIAQKKVVYKAKDEIRRSLNRLKNIDQTYHESYSGHEDDPLHDVARVNKKQREYERKRKELEDVLQLDRDVIAIERDIIETEKLIKELNAIVKEQEENTDTVDGDGEHTEAFIPRGAQHIQNPRLYRNKYQKKKIILALIGTVIVAIIIGIIVWITI